MTLTRDQRKQLRAAFIDAFRTKPKLQQFLKEELDKNLDIIALGDDLEELIFKLIQNADSRGWETQLIFAARESNPDNPKLSAFVRVYEKEYWEQLVQKANHISCLLEKASCTTRVEFHSSHRTHRMQ